MIKLNCKNCGEKFWTKPSQIKIGKGKFCSKKCFYKSLKGKIVWNKGLTKETDKRIKKYSLKMSINRKGKHYSPKTEIKKGMTGIKSIAYKIGLPKCLNCRKTLLHTKQKRCKKCNKLFQIGYNTSNWRGGISFEPYSIDWTKTLKRAIRQRDNYICQICSQYGNIVHHIDYNKKNCNPKNLITLCKSCHTKTNYNRNYWKEYFSNSQYNDLKLLSHEF